jgi:hypothetical protein
VVALHFDNLTFRREIATRTQRHEAQSLSSMRKHLEQVLVDDDSKLAESLTAFGDFLKTSYFYPSGSYEKCEDPRVPNAWANISRKFEPFTTVSQFSAFSISVSLISGPS